MNKLRDQRSEPEFAALTKFVVNKAKLANTEYGQLVNVKMDCERNKTKSYVKPQRNVSAYQVSNISSNEEQDGKRNITMKLKCIFCRKEGHSLGKSYMFQEKSYAERKKFVSKKGLCNLCLAKGHFASKFQKGRKCFIAGCGRRHHTLLHSTEYKREEDSTKVDKDKESTAKPKGLNAQNGHCGTADIAKRQVCLRVIPVKVSGRDNSREKITYAIRDEGSNTTLVKELKRVW